MLAMAIADVGRRYYAGSAGCKKYSAGLGQTCFPAGPPVPEGIAEMRQEARDLGIVFSQDAC